MIEEQKAEETPCLDVVNRATLIDKLEIIDRKYGSDFYWSVRKIVDSVPPVASRKKGRWIKEYDNSALDGFYHCSICGRKLWIPKDQSFLDYPYCHCGAEMEVEE